MKDISVKKSLSGNFEGCHYIASTALFLNRAVGET